MFVLLGSGALLIFWFHTACRALSHARFERDNASDVAGRLHLDYRRLHEALRKGTSQASTGTDPLTYLERDYRALIYLLDRTEARGAALGLLRLDFQFLRLWVQLLRLLRLETWRATLLEMICVLDYFGNTIGRQWQASTNRLAVAWEGSAAGPILSVCSYCRYVRSPEDREAEWVTLKEYKRQGRSVAVALSHGICPSCLDHLVRPST